MALNIVPINAFRFSLSWVVCLLNDIKRAGRTKNENVRCVASRLRLLQAVVKLEEDKALRRMTGFRNRKPAAVLLRQVQVVNGTPCLYASAMRSVKPRE